MELRRPLPDTGQPDTRPIARLRFELGGQDAAEPPAAPSGEVIYTSPHRTSDGTPISLLRREADGTQILHFSSGPAFRLGRERIVAEIPSPSGEHPVELLLIGPVLAYSLELQGVLALHASVVGVGGRAIGFLADQGTGKSCLAAAMLTAGHSLLADDILVIGFPSTDALAFPGYPWQRMRPAVVEHFLGRERPDFERVHPRSDKLWIPASALGRFAEYPRPLSALCIPERHMDSSLAIEIQVLGRAHALIELVRFSFAARLIEAAGLQPRRLDLLARLARTVPVFRLRYPDGLEHLPRVAERLLEHL